MLENNLTEFHSIWTELNYTWDHFWCEMKSYHFRSKVLEVVNQKIVWLLLHKKNSILITPIIQIIIFDGEEQ